MTSANRESLNLHVQKFRKVNGGRVVFVVMRFANNLLLQSLYEIIKTEATALGVKALRADDWEFSSQLWTNIEIYMLGADAGIVIFDGIQTGGRPPAGFNPNVSIEAGYLLGLDKPVLFLRDQYMELMPTDFQGMLYSPFDPDQPESARVHIRKWLQAVFA
jgi:hypothetical protein